MAKRQAVAGILAHVDAGKTTLAEAMLYNAGVIRRLGRVDHGDSALDSDRQERERGITIFASQARLQIGIREPLALTLLDTPGHVDFSAEMERTLSVLDCAILVISGPEGIQAHTRTLWQLLERYRLPCFIFVNKTDICEKTREQLLSALNGELGSCADFSLEEKDPEAFYEQLALTDERLLEGYLEGRRPTREELCQRILRRRLFPVYFGSALKNEGVDAFTEGLSRYISCKTYPEAFGARVFRITYDEKGTRLTHLKLTGGALKVRGLLEEEKITELRLCSGSSFEPVQEAFAGEICALCGPEKTYAGQCLGAEQGSGKSLLEPVMSYALKLPPDTDPFTAYQKLIRLSEEDPALGLEWKPELREISLRLMGQVQREVLEKRIAQRYDLAVKLEQGRILYRETIAGPVIGHGHFEPLRHYAEVHLLLEPLPRGMGILLESACSTDRLELNWQRLILSELGAKRKTGVLTGAPLTDVKITLIAGRSHIKHTEGGDFREAACRALRQGLMQAENVLLEPLYRFVLEVPAEQLGRAISDMKAMSASFEAPEESGDGMRLTGTVPVSEIGEYYTTLLSYTGGRGRLSLVPAGYAPCHDSEAVIREAGYEPERDLSNPADSVFCSHGAGVTVRWNAAEALMHMSCEFASGQDSREDSAPLQLRSAPRASLPDKDEQELEAILKREFGEPRRPRYFEPKKSAAALEKQQKTAALLPEYLIVDGYNIIHAWKELENLLTAGTDSACLELMDLLADYRGYRGGELVLVFDGYARRGSPGTKENYKGIHVVFTPEGESADFYIERLVQEIGKNYRVRVATSDGLIQLQALRSGVLRLSARELRWELEQARGEVKALLEQNRRDHAEQKVLEGWEHLP